MQKRRIGRQQTFLSNGFHWVLLIGSVALVSYLVGFLYLHHLAPKIQVDRPSPVDKLTRANSEAAAITVEGMKKEQTRNMQSVIGTNMQETAASSSAQIQTREKQHFECWMKDPVIDKAAMTVDYGEWSMPFPHFTRPEHDAWFQRYEFFREVEARCAQGPDPRRIYFRDDKYTRGRVVVRSDVVVQDTAKHDCGQSGRVEQLLVQGTPQRTPRRTSRLFWNVIPAVWTFQHWMENTLPKMAQAAFFVKDWSNVSMNQELALDRMPIVAEIYKHIGMEVFDDRTGPIQTHELIYSCNAPPLHPMLWQLGQEQFLRVPKRPGPRPRRIAYCSRHTADASNGGRRVMNEEQLLAALRATGWTIEIFNRLDHKSVQDLINYFQGVGGLMGAHGGCLTNLLFMPPGSLVVEFMPLVNGVRPPLGHPGMMMYVQATFLNMDYWLFPVHTSSHQGDLEAPISEVFGVIKQYDSA